MKRFDATPVYIDAFVKSFAYKTILRKILQKALDNVSKKYIKHFID